MSATEHPNYDPATGISYGVISMHSIYPDALDDICFNGEDLTYQGWLDQTKNELHAMVTLAVKDTVGDRLADDMADAAVEVFDNNAGDCYDSPGDTAYYYKQEGVELFLTDEIKVTKSPYFTVCMHCSPCHPNAGNLDGPCNDTHAEEVCVPTPHHVLYGMVRGPLKAYCLPPDWFEDEVCPYSVYEVKTGKCIYKAPQAQEG